MFDVDVLIDGFVFVLFVEWLCDVFEFVMSVLGFGVFGDVYFGDVFMFFVDLLV